MALPDWTFVRLNASVFKMKTMPYEDCVVTGGAGMIGSELVSVLCRRGVRSKILDDFSTKRYKNTHAGVELVRGDITDATTCKKAINTDLVFHLAGRPTIKDGLDKPGDTFIKGVLGTVNVLEAMRANDAKSIVFASSAMIYGNLASERPMEDYGPLIPASIYGASKLACENLICSYCKTYGFRSYIYRLSNIVGSNSNHGVIRDFVLKLKENPEEMDILGNGNQERSFVYVSDCVAGMLHALDKASDQINVFNLGNSDKVSIREVATIVSSELGLAPQFHFEKSMYGKSDLRALLMDSSRLESLGWKCSLSSREAVKKCVRDMVLL